MAIAWTSAEALREWELMMHITTIIRRTPEWPDWGHGNGVHSWPVVEGEIEQGALFWTKLEGVVYSLTWTWAGWITAKHYERRHDGWHGVYDKSLFAPVEAETDMREIMLNFPSYLIRWQL